jgi:hypothetical protein
MTGIASRPSRAARSARAIELEEAPALAHDVPVILPAHQVGEAGIDRLVGEQVLHRLHAGTQDQQYHGHADELRPRIGEGGLGPQPGQQGHNAADEHRDRRVEHGGDRADDEQRDQQPLHLARVMPIERAQALGRRRIGRQRGRLQ